MGRPIKPVRTSVRCPGSCGELVQGTAAGAHFLVTCPIDLYSDVSVTLSPTLLPAPKVGEKTQEAVRQTLRYFKQADCHFDISIRTDLPKGKGMASSSADISAACMATAVGLGYTLTPDEIATIALRIEPTDGVFFPGIMMLDHVEGVVRRSLGTPPPIRIAVLDMGGEVDTVGFNQRQDLAMLNQWKEPQVLAALKMVEEGIRRGDTALLGAGTTLSALANQTILPKPLLEEVIEISRQCGALGVNVAHSGTVVGILFDPARGASPEECIKKVSTAYPELRPGKVVSLVPGGLTVMEERTECQMQ